MRKVRNAFAHSVKTSFDDEKVKKEMGPLVERYGIAYSLAGTFEFAAMNLTTALLNRADHARQQRLRAQEWDTRRTDYSADLDYDPY